MHYLGNNCVERILSNECLVESSKLICLFSFLYAYAQYFKIKLDQHYEFSWVMVEQLNKKKKVALKIIKMSIIKEQEIVLDQVAQIKIRVFL